MPRESMVTVKKFFPCLFGNRSTTGRSDGPWTPQFRLRLSFCSITIVFVVCLVVLFVVGTQIVQSEAIEARNDADALLGFAFFLTLNLRAANESVRKMRHAVPAPQKEVPAVRDEPTYGSHPKGGGLLDRDPKNGSENLGGVARRPTDHG